MATKVIQNKGEHVNCYLLVNGNDAVLVDTGMKEDLDDIIEMCKPYNVKLIALTHGHGDHTYNANYLSEFFGVPIAMSEKDVELIEDGDAQPMQADTPQGFALLEFTKRNKESAPRFHPNIYLRDGNTLSEFGIPATVVELPGHTKGSIGFDLEGRDLIVGDAMLNATEPVLAITFNDKAKALESVEKISGLGKRNLYFGHGNPVLSEDNG